MAYGLAKARPDAFYDKRQCARRQVRRTVEIATLTRHQIAATVCDLSRVGCGLVTNDHVAVGSFVEIVFDERIRPAGWVTWSRNGAFGVDFDYPLVPAAFEEILIESSLAQMAPPFEP
ncbi:PilZ domain-containing protein [Sphingomonas qomolangmaensis]|uniref:PilZ domain-containing protein n=1 Tax=Sphingomonas qomolangmaensis TaxID=2918765 RepID=A0ABY5L9D0_9SPHN|nr:PilZ domain-containing protein [Sphingomonas qomolangmaensis]UUL82414.1 PilZ domain-containing protein [Sphingomonas qomolangmaensis]